MSTPGESGVVDRAGLLGAALAAIVALTFGGQGEWDWLAACAGVALLAVLAAFFRFPTGRTRRGVTVELAALAAVTALSGVLVVAAPLQAVLADTTAAGRECRAAGAVAAALVLTDPAHARAATVAAPTLADPVDAGEAHLAAARNAGRDVEGICLGAATSRLLWLPAVLIGLSTFAATWWWMRRRHVV